MTEIIWLDADEQNAWRSYLRATRLLDEELRRGLESHDLSHQEYEILVRLSEAAQRTLRMAELAASVVSSRSRLTHTVGRLEKAGLVTRQRCVRDGRGVECHLTVAGMSTVKAAARTHVADVRRGLLNAVSRKDFLALGAILAQVAHHLDPEGKIVI
ncbi:MAG: MarR family winged helix-turn-helix transcriptional regulator [Actinomycetota bacterium]